MNTTGSPSERSAQLVVEVGVRDLDLSLNLYTALGFRLERRDQGFASLLWGTQRLFLAEKRELSELNGPSRANIRIIVPNVDAVWKLVQTLGVEVERPIGDRYYGLRDFTIRDPDGFGIRFGSEIVRK